MPDRIRSMNAFACSQIDKMAAVASAFARGAENIFNETQDFQAATLKNNAAWFSKTVFARNLSELIQAQAEHVKAHYDASLGESRKIGEILTDFTRDTVKSVMQDATSNAPAASASRQAPVMKIEAPARREAA